MKKNLKIIVLLIILIIFIITVSIILIKRKNKSSNDTNIADGNTVIVEENKITIKSTKKNKIEKDGIEAEQIGIEILGEQLKIETIVKNNTSETIKGFQIVIDLLDEDGNTLTTISSNETDNLEPKKSVKIDNYADLLENQDKIRSAKIVSIDKGSMNDSIDNMIDKMDPEL